MLNRNNSMEWRMRTRLFLTIAAVAFTVYLLLVPQTQAVVEPGEINSVSGTFSSGDTLLTVGASGILGCDSPTSFCRREDYVLGIVWYDISGATSYSAGGFCFDPDGTTPGCRTTIPPGWSLSDPVDVSSWPAGTYTITVWLDDSVTSTISRSTIIIKNTGPTGNIQVNSKNDVTGAGIASSWNITGGANLSGSGTQQVYSNQPASNTNYTINPSTTPSGYSFKGIERVEFAEPRFAWGVPQWLEWVGIAAKALNYNPGGQSQTLSAGSPACSAAAAPCINFNLNWTPLPTISVSPASLSFSAQQGTNPGNQNVSISNSGAPGSTLNWNSSISYSSGSGWLSLSPSSGNGIAQGSSQNVSAIVTSASLGVGTYNATVTIDDQAGDPLVAPASFGVTLNVSAAPAPTVSLSVSATPIIIGQSTTLSWTTTNAASPCTASGDWSGSKAVPSGNEVVTPSSVGTKTYTLTCNNGFGVTAQDSETVQVNNPAPSITSLNPNNAIAGSGGFTLTVNGSNFVNGSVVRWNGSNRTTTFVSGSQLTAIIPSSDIASAGTAQVTVFNPTPGGDISNAVNFTISSLTADIKANGSDGPITIPYNTSATISWTSSDVISCSVAPTGWTGTSGSQSTGNLVTSQTYTLTCTNGSVNVNDSVVVNVQANGPPGPPGSTEALSPIAQGSNYCVADNRYQFTWTYFDPDGDAQWGYRVQVARDTAFNQIVDDSNPGDSPTSGGSSTFYTPLVGMPYNTTLYFRIKVWDNQGNMSAWSFNAGSDVFTTINHAYPTVSFTPPPPASVPANSVVQFTSGAQCYNSSGGTVACSSTGWFWNFGDGVTATSQNPSHTYDVAFVSPPPVTVLHRATDTSGQFCELQQDLDIGAAQTLPDWREVGPL